MHMIKVRKEIHALENCPAPPSQNNGPSLKDYVVGGGVTLFSPFLHVFFDYDCE